MSDETEQDVFAKIYYALGWDYVSSKHVLLKYLHAHPELPFKISGIIHDCIFVDEVDGIPLITTADFLSQSFEQGTVLVPLTNQKAWAQWVAATLASQGVVSRESSIIVRDIAAALHHEGKVGLTLGPILFPDICAGKTELPSRDETPFVDEHSQKIFMGYLDFLANPHTENFTGLTSLRCTNPFNKNWFAMSGFDDARPPLAVVELAEDGPNHAGQFWPYMGPLSRYYHVASARHHAELSAHAQKLFSNTSPAFYRLVSDIANIPNRVWQHPETVLIVNKALTKDEFSFLSRLPLTRNRLLLRAGTSRKGFHDALKLAENIQPFGVRRLRTYGPSPDKIYLFSSGNLDSDTEQ